MGVKFMYVKIYRVIITLVKLGRITGKLHPDDCAVQWTRGTIPVFAQSKISNLCISGRTISRGAR